MLSLPAAAFAAMQVATTPTPAAAQSVSRPAGNEAGFSPAVRDVLELINAKVSPEVIKAYIGNQPYAYGLNAGQIVALQQLGVSSDVLEALVGHKGHLAQPTPAAPPVYPAPAQPPPAPAAATFPQTVYVPAYEAPASTYVSYPVYYPPTYSYWWYSYGYPWVASYTYWPAYYYGCGPYRGYSGYYPYGGYNCGLKTGNHPYPHKGYGYPSGSHGRSPGYPGGHPGNRSGGGYSGPGGGGYRGPGGGAYSGPGGGGTRTPIQAVSAGAPRMPAGGFRTGSTSFARPAMSPAIGRTAPSGMSAGFGGRAAGGGMRMGAPAGGGGRGGGRR